MILIALWLYKIKIVHKQVCKNDCDLEGKHMYINPIFELKMTLDNEKFHKILDKVISRAEYMEETEDEYIDLSLANKGIIATYRNSQSKKRIKLIINSGVMMNCSEPDPNEFIRKLDKRLGKYFDNKYCINDFDLSGMMIDADINVHSHKNVLEYLRVLKRIGKVKGFSPSVYEGIDEDSSFCLTGKSNGIECLIYDLERVVLDQHKDVGSSKKELRLISENTKGVLRIEIRLTKLDTILIYTDDTDVSEQLAELTEYARGIVIDVLELIVPFGDYYKKDKAKEIICSEVKDAMLRSKMYELLTLIPKKKTLYLAQKIMDCKNIKKVMKEFAYSNLSPITISEGRDVEYLKSLYTYLHDYTSSP